MKFQLYGRFRLCRGILPLLEELYLLEGDLCVGEMSMRAGDYCRGEAGSIHEEIVTRSRCLFVVTSSHHDQLMA